MSAEENQAVFLSYASQDAEAVRRIAETLRAAGVEVWFDQNELVGGDAWDQKIRGQIKACALFVPVISAATQARREGYFRLEWKLAAQRTHMISERQAFLLPVVIDATSEAAADVPEEFRAVQWTRLAGGGEGNVLERFCARVGKLLGYGAELQPATGPTERRLKHRATVAARSSWRWAVVTLVGVVAVGVLAIWGPWRSAGGAPVVAAPAGTPAGGEVGQLLERARQLRVLNDLTRERLGAAEELLKQAAKLSPTDPDVLAVQAQVDVLMSYRSWDRSEERRQVAGQRAARAVALAPDGFESRRAQAMVAAFMLQSPEALQEAEATYRRLTGERPRDANVLEELGTILLWQGKPLEAARIFTQAGQRLLAATAQMWAGQARQARDGAVALLAERRSVGALVLKANVDLFSFNDREAARVSVSQLTPTELREDDAAGIALRLAVLSADAPGLLKLMEQFPHPFVSILGINYPRRYWTGMAREWLKQPDAARIEWRAALLTIEERLKANPADSDALSWAALLHMCLGDVAATEQALRAYRNYRDLSTGYWDFHYCLPLLRVAGGEDEAIDRLEKTLRQPPDGQFNTMVYAWARFSPEFDPLRGKPRFEQLLREMRPADALPFADAPAPAGAVAAAQGRVSEKSLAVLPFDNLSDDKANDIFSDGISEALIHALGRVPGLTVKGRTSSFYFKEQKRALPPREMAAQLGVAYLLRGGVRKIGTTVRITAQLSRAATDEIVWASEPIKRELTDVFDVQDEIATLVAKQLSLALGQPAIAARAVSPEASLLYLQAMHLWRNRFGADYLDKLGQAETMIRRAVAIEPTFVDALVRLAEVLIFREAALSPIDQAGRLQSTLEEGLRWADRAVELDPNSAEAHSLRAKALEHAWRRSEADVAFQRAIRINPNFAVARARYARFLEADGRMDEAIAELERSIQLDPLASRALDNLALMLIHAGRYTGALAAAERSLALAPDNYQALFYQAQALFHLGRKDAGTAVATKLAMLEPEPFAKSDFAAYTCDLLIAQGRHDDAVRFFEKISPTLVADRSFAAAALGRTSVALEVLNAHWLPSIWLDEVMWHPHFDKMRSAPEFVAWLKKTGLTEVQARAQAWRAAHPPEKPEAKK